MCASNTLLPRSLRIELCDDPTSVALFRGGFGDVYRRRYQGRDVAVKVLRIYRDTDIPKFTRVRRGDTKNSTTH